MESRLRARAQTNLEVDSQRTHQTALNTWAPIMWNVRLPLAIGGLCFVLATTAIASLAESGQSDPQPLVIAVQSQQTVIAGVHFNLPLVAQGGFPPYNWSIADGHLPPGLKLLPHKGVISGVAATPGEYHFILAVADSTVPQSQQMQREMTLIVIAGLTIDWNQPPKVHGNAISGSALVSNQTGHPMDVTVIVVAVNKIGRATALGYQHFNLAAQSSSPVIPFGSSPGTGTYFVRADAAAHRKNGHHVFRASKQTADTLQITQF